MREIARRPEKDRRDLFRAAAQRMRVHEAIVEKDFWVCWVLDYLFNDSPWKDGLAFKGGTSLSKAFAAIERFSEDIDLILDWRLLGYALDEPWEERSVTRQEAFGKDSNRRTVDFLSSVFVPAVRGSLADRLGASIKVEAKGQEVLLHYPTAFSLAAIQPQIRLEIGPMAAWIPNERRMIRPYAAEQIPDRFNQKGTLVRTITAERTFWEKATILHQEAHRGAEKQQPPRYSRHYYDLFRLSRLPIRARAMERIELLDDVVQFKMRFYRCPWACYEKARPGSFRLIPPERHSARLRKDFQSMRAMLFGSIPEFDEIMSELADLEASINAMGTDTP